MKMRIGAHVSASGGLGETIKRAKEIGANTIQIFGASPVRWQASLPDKKEAEKFYLEAKENDILPIFLHAPYLINLPSQKENLPSLSKNLLKKHLEISNAIKANGVIFHIGSRGDREEKEGLKIVIDSIKQILEDVKEGNLLIENSAGAGNLVGDTLEEISEIIKSVKSNRLGMCLDTAHAFESGILPDYSKKSIDEFSKKIDKLIGFDKILAVHLNDSKTPSFSNKDRHENIGEGMIGKEGIKNFINHKDFKKLPFLLEVPGFDDNGPDKKNIDIVKSLVVE